MKTNKVYLGVVALIIGITITLADNPTPIDPKEKELNELLKKSEKRLLIVNDVAKRIDKISNEQVTSMKEDIKALQEENHQLIIKLDETQTPPPSTDSKSSVFIMEPISDTKD